MADFITRLTERALDMAPVVQPLIASMFAPEPTHYAPDIEWDGEATTPSRDLDWGHASPAQGIPPDQDPSKVVPEDTATNQSEKQGASAPITPPPTPVASDTSPRSGYSAEADPSKHGITFVQEEDQGVAATTAPNPLQRAPDAAEPGSFEGEVEPRQEDQQNLSSATSDSWPAPSHIGDPGSLERKDASGGKPQNPSRATARPPRTTLEPRPETLYHAERGPTQRGTLSTPRQVLSGNPTVNPPSAEGEPDQALSLPTKTLVGRSQGGDHGQDTTLPLVPALDTESSLDANGGTREPEATLSHPALSTLTSPIAPRMVRSRLNDNLERSPRETPVAVPERPAPTIRVAIGRIEVRAITAPPASPAQRITPARPDPALSLDDYLKQRNEGQR